MGKEEPTPSNNDSSNTSHKVTEIKQQSPSNESKEKRPEPERKIIKFDTPEKSTTTKTSTNTDTIKIISDKTPGTTADTAREELEQRRTVLQNMKDFDFQIKKNQEDITSVSNKVESLSKDLDDLVSLYEIVSEQMNPFVGLSKVTKKRLDALENIIKEVEGVKTRIGDLESALEKTVVNGKRNNTSTPTKSPTVTGIESKTPSQPNGPEIITMSQQTGLQSTVTEKVTEGEINDALNKALESLLIEQNIDTVINEFFINLK